MNIWAQRARDQQLVQGPREELLDEIESLDSILDELAQLGESTTNDSVRLGVIKARMVAHEKRLLLRKAAGILPWDLSSINEGLELGVLIRALGQMLANHNVSDDVWDELFALMEQAQSVAEDKWFEQPLTLRPPAESKSG